MNKHVGNRDIFKEGCGALGLMIAKDGEHQIHCIFRVFNNNLPFFDNSREPKDSKRGWCCRYHIRGPGCTYQ